MEHRLAKVEEFNSATSSLEGVESDDEFLDAEEDT